MSLETALAKCDVDLTVKQVEAFLLGVSQADKPLAIQESIKELFIDGFEVDSQFESEAVRVEVEKEIYSTWNNISAHSKKFMETIFDSVKSHSKEDVLNIANLVDFFLMGLSLSGTSYDTVENQDMAELLEDLEDWVIDVDEWVAEGEDTDNLEDWKEDGIVLKEEFYETWDKLTKNLK